MYVLIRVHNMCLIRQQISVILKLKADKATEI